MTDDYNSQLRLAAIETFLTRVSDNLDDDFIVASEYARLDFSLKGGVMISYAYKLFRQIGYTIGYVNEEPDYHLIDNYPDLNKHKKLKLLYDLLLELKENPLTQ